MKQFLAYASEYQQGDIPPSEWFQVAADSAHDALERVISSMRNARLAFVAIADASAPRHNGAPMAAQVFELQQRG